MFLVILFRNYPYAFIIVEDPHSTDLPSVSRLRLVDVERRTDHEVREAVIIEVRYDQGVTKEGSSLTAREVQIGVHCRVEDGHLRGRGFKIKLSFRHAITVLNNLNCLEVMCKG